MPKFSIIVPVCGQLEITKNCVDSIERNTKDYELIIVDNGSFPAYEGSGIIIKNNENLGFPHAINQGIKASTGEIIILLNNDTIVTPDWAEHLAEHLKYSDLVGPVTNNISGFQCLASAENIAIDNVDSFALELYKNRCLDSYALHRLVFFCIAFKRSVVDKIGLLDEQFFPGNFEDDDYCMSAIDAGLVLSVAQDVFIYHIGSVTHKKLQLDYTDILEVNRRKFEAKWSLEKRQSAAIRCSQNYNNSRYPLDQSIALVMVVKNEAQGLAKAVESCKDICQEIVIAVDNSSSDQTLEIAKQLATTVKTFDFSDNFAAARNYAHDGVKSDWILFLDGHETLVNQENVKKHLDKRYDGFLTRVRMENGCLFPNPRIYRNGCEFSGAVHEQLDCKNTKVVSDVFIQHNRENSQSVVGSTIREKQRNDLMPRIMGSQIEKDKKNTRAAFHMGLFYQSKYDFKKSLKYFKLYLKYSNVPGGRWFVYYNIALSHYEQKHYYRAWLATCEAKKINPKRWEIEELQGLIMLEQKNYQDASEHFVKAFNNNEGDITFEPKQKNLSVIWNFIGECLYNMSKFDKACEAFMQASKTCDDPTFKEVLDRRATLMLDMSKQ